MLNLNNELPPATDKDGVVNAIIEIPRGRRNKFEVDKRYGLLKLDRYLYASSHYPGDYGMIPQTLASDGDPLDILVMVNEPTFPGCLIEARVVGLFKMIEDGEKDSKLLAVPDTDPHMSEYRELDDIPGSFLKEVEYFFQSYKKLEGAEIITEGWFSREEGLASLDRAISRYKSGR